MNTNRKQTRHLPSAAVLAAAIATSVALVALSGCSDSNAQAPAAAAAPPPVSVAAALQKEIVETQEFSGRIEAVDRAEIRARVSGTIDAVRFSPGAEVKKGDVLVVIDPRPYRAEAERADAAAASAAARAELAKTELERSNRLMADNAIAKRDNDERVAAAKQLAADARAARAAADAARLNLEFTTVRAPITGRVSKAEVTVGNLIDPTVVLTSVVSSNPIYASFEGDEQTFARLGGPARALQTTVGVGLVGEDGFPHQGKLEFIDNRVNPATGSVRMRALLDNKDGLLAEGRFARVSIGGGNQSKPAVLISDRAVGTDQDRKFVYVVTPAADGKGYKADYRAVRLGPVVDGYRVVRSGLKSGEKVVVNGLQRVRPGAPITPQDVTMDATTTAKRVAPGDEPAPAEAAADDRKAAARAG